ncbi:MAG: hypothetical protein ABIZ91_16665 [Gemmatimonadaceae bacterium]
MLSSRTRVLLAFAALLLTALYFVPLWRVSLSAPQYPEGIGLRIWINTVSGAKPNDLQNINGLNHYIGMQRIEPESIPELRYMPYIVAALIATGLGVAALGRRRPARLWTAGFLLVAVVGLADFWKWEYDYGHNLDMENAIIKVPGMTYQPPLIGTKQLLNFSASSWPDVGGILAVVSLGIAVGVLVVDGRARRTAEPAVAPTTAARIDAA